MLSPNVRAGLLMQLIHSTLRDTVRNKQPHRHLTGEWLANYYRNNRHVDATTILCMLEFHTDLFKIDAADKGEISDLAKALRAHRRQWAHQYVITRAESENAAFDASRMFQLLGERTASLNAENLAQAPVDGDIKELRKLLVSRTNPVLTITYAETLRALKLKDEESGRNHLYRMLNGLGGWQKAIGEPLLCALVVLDETEAKPKQPAGLPGRGFYWLVDENGDAEPDVKKRVHQQELNRIKEFNWRR